MKKSAFEINKDEIDVFDLLKVIWLKRRIVLFVTFAFMFLGLFVAFFSPKEYTASSIFIPQTSESGKTGGALGGLASLAGINLGGMGVGSDIPPSLYPKIVSSVTFQKSLIQATINVQGVEEQVSYMKYYDDFYTPDLLEILKKYSVGLPNLIIDFFKKKRNETNLNNQNDLNLIWVSLEESNHFKRLALQLTVTPNEKEGFVSLNFVMPEPLMAAQMAKTAEKLLEKEIIQFKIQNAQEQLKFTEKRFLEKQKEFDEIQKRLANFRDRNQNLTSASILNELQKLEAEFNFSFSIYTELAKQLEQAKLQVTKDTPILSVIQPVTVPIEKSGPNRPLLLFLFTFLGFVISLGYIFFEGFILKIKETWN